MINVVELIVDKEFMDVNRLKNTYVRGIKEYLSNFGYNVTPIDRSEWYSYERKILMDTNAPEPLVSNALDMQNKKQKDAYAVLVN
ncbi:MAG: hypothetical protein ACM3NG_00315 [Candidatus Doudnabacteria bacterium]